MDRPQVKRGRGAFLAAALATLAFSGCADFGERFAPNYCVGTQTFAPKYHFTEKTRLVETAQAMLDMGSNVIKFAADPAAMDAYHLPANPEIKTLKDLFALEPSYQAVLSMPFDYYLVWAYPLGTAKSCREAWTEEDRRREYDEMYGLTRYLLEKFSGTNKTFLLGHWEGDWVLLGGYDINAEPKPESVTGMINWLNLRQKAVDDALRDTSHHGVHVFHYTEVNLVQKAIAGRTSVCNSVLPHTNVDMVSYSSYDSLDLSKGAPAMRERLKTALDYVAAKLPEKELEWNVPRVFIGEYGFPIRQVQTPEAQKQDAREVIRAGLEWGCPFILYWEMYDNEMEEGSEKTSGFWMIDNHGVIQPVYRLHRQCIARGREWSAQFRCAHFRAPTHAEYCRAALQWLDAAGSAAYKEQSSPC
jgi:hypothetical protein